MTGPDEVLVVGSGYVARHVTAALGAAGWPVTTSSRRPPAAPSRWHRLDAARAQSWRELGAALRPAAVVLAHGPSDITWCESNPAVAALVHVGSAVQAVRHFPQARTLLVSTDNVFDGTAVSYGEPDRVSPANAYGRAKAAAERVVLEAGPACVLRVSLVYGADSHGLRPNFATTAALSLLAGRPVEAPTDHWNTPVLVDDVAAVAAACLQARLTRVLHLGGPERVSRYEWGRRLAEEVGADPALVRPVRRADTRYVCRPASACLHSTVIRGGHPLARLPVRGLTAGGRLLRRELAGPPAPPVSVPPLLRSEQP